MSDEMIWAQLVHFGHNFWLDRDARPFCDFEYTIAEDTMRFDREVWNDVIDELVKSGANAVLMDVGDGLRYESHPEIAVEGAWTVAELKEELARVRGLGITPLPKLNFSACHDVWLKDYSRMLSTPKYYEVVADLIAELCQVFDTPPLFHLGMDEENWENQRHNDISIIRQHDLWWKDLLFMVEHVEKAGSRAWVWSDYLWHDPEAFLARMPKSVMQSNWYYGFEFHDERNGVKAYHILEEAGYDQIPTGANWTDADNFRKTVLYCAEHIDESRLHGFLQTTWKPTLTRRRYRLLEGAAEIGVGRKAWEELKG